MGLLDDYAEMVALELKFSLLTLPTIIAFSFGMFIGGKHLGVEAGVVIGLVLAAGTLYGILKVFF
ncbi:hypothetical protein [Halobacterium jilantaiense]|uniref:Uncharacterized protein n=1 Tax=Halobacterium jilantaiense TaxID=355548 RepID=A0A1I0NB73_9EURY|nr:hypothetical protein [Halobacterium jilantaiense]SEV98052.1 hypothetical protein SAMN04487945_0713 [Halobacterium jilantaiense]